MKELVGMRLLERTEDKECFRWWREFGDTVCLEGSHVKIFFFLGQSNMVGRGVRDEFPSEMSTCSEQCVRLTDDGWVVQELHPTFNGPEVSFFHRMKAVWPNETIGIIKVALAGTGIRAFQPNWSFLRAHVELGDGWKGPLYELIRERIDKARQWCIPEFLGVFWKQGLTDMKKLSSSLRYGVILEEIIAEIRNDTGVDSLPFFVGTYFTEEELKRSDIRGLLSRFRPLTPSLHVLYDQIAAEQRIPYTQVVYHGWLPQVDPKSIHFNTSGQIDLGFMFADAYVDYVSL